MGLEEYVIIFGAIILLILPFAVMNMLGFLEPKPKDFLKEINKIISYFWSHLLSYIKNPELIMRSFSKEAQFIKNPNPIDLMTSNQKRNLALGLLSSCQNLIYFDSLSTGLKPFKLELIFKEIEIYSADDFLVFIQEEINNSFFRDYIKISKYINCDKKTYKEAMRKYFEKKKEESFLQIERNASLDNKRKTKLKKRLAENISLSQENATYYFSDRKRIYEELKAEKIISSYEDLQNKSAFSWNADGAIFYIRVAYDLKMIGQQEAWSLIEQIYHTSCSLYQNWEEYFQGYLIGKAFYGGYFFEHNKGVDYIPEVLTSKTSPLKNIKFK